MATVALGTVVRELIRAIYPQGSNPKAFPAIVEGSLSLGTAQLPLQPVLIIVTSVTVVALMYYLLQKTPIGTRIRAVAEDRETARLEKHDPAFAPPSRVEQCQRHQRGLAGAGRRDEHGRALPFERRPQGRQHLADGKPRQDRSGHGFLLGFEATAYQRQRAHRNRADAVAGCAGENRARSGATKFRPAGKN